MNLKHIIDDKLLDEVVEELMKSENLTALKKPDGQYTSDLGKMKSRIDNIESRLEKYVKSFKIVAMEVERQLVEKNEELNKEREQRVLKIQGHVEDLRTAMIRLSNEVKRIKDALSPSQ